jgi:hypothetical protein
MAAGALDHYTIEELAKRCEQQHVHDDARAHEPYCQEIFRRAVISDDRAIVDACWEEIRRLYRGVIVQWMRRRLYRMTDDELFDMADDVLARFWKYFRRAQFEGATHFGSILVFLRRSANSVAMDWHREGQRMRTDSETDVATDSITSDASVDSITPFDVATSGVMSKPLPAVETDVEQRSVAQLAWAIISNEIARNERERIVAKLMWSEGLKPGQIYGLHTDKFRDVGQVYEIVRALKKRAVENGKLRDLFQK